jgi:hypothetical protein
MATAPELEEALLGAGFDQRIVVGSPGAFLDSSAVRVLIASARDSRRRAALLGAPDAGILSSQISGVDTMLRAPTLDAAQTCRPAAEGSREPLASSRSPGRGRAA